MTPDNDKNRDPIQSAQEYGVDIDLIESNLKKSYEERVDSHQAALELVEEIQKTREIDYSES